VLGKPPVGLEPAAQARLLGYGWPGNIDELYAVIELAVARSRGPRVLCADLPAIGPGAVQENPLDGTLERVERRVLQRALERTAGNKSEAARLLGLKRTTFLDKLRRHGLDEPPSGKRSMPPAPN
jgi:transcriptional regulator of acetoin/glycerol metabolism